MHISEEFENGRLSVLVDEKRVNVLSGRAINELVQAKVPSDLEEVLILFKSTNYISSSGIRQILNISKALKEKDIDFKLVVYEEFLLKFMDDLQLNDIINIEKGK